ncbi:MAG: translation initiation factor IF-2 [Dethiosulfovibrio peptidovorans]|nr:MAG: translation initiation factor IF-2 [Dethiosulfovibrio peptidovorans]
MSKIRVYELAKMLDMSNKDLMEVLRGLEIEAKSHMSSLELETAQRVEDYIKNGDSGSGEKGILERCSCSVPEGATVKDVAEMIDVSPAEVVKTLIAEGIMAPATASVDDTILAILSEAYSVDLEWAPPEPQEEPLTVAKKPVLRGDNLCPRAPIVTVMGHVDHGKTTLLDSIRNTNITAREAGGITQHIGASRVCHGDKDIVFLDTPGHAAFTSMRARGAQCTDIAILVVAADDGVMPQTVEAINHAKAAGVPIIVAVNKIDKAGANPDRVQQQLSDHGLVPEAWGGDTIMVHVSAKSGENLDQLLEMVLLVAEMEELKADPTVTPEGVVIEAELDKGKGSVATVLVQQGTLRRGDIVLLDSAWGKVRAMIDASGKQVKTAGPSTAVEILGLNDVPQPGERFVVAENEKEARDCISAREQERRREANKIAPRMTLEELYTKMRDGETPLLNLLLKCDVQGSVEALIGSLDKLATDEVGINIVHTGVGGLSESDIMLASASDAIVIGFNVRPDANAKKMAEKEHVQIRLYRVIYDIIDDIKAAMEGMLAPHIRESVVGQAEIREIFKVPKVGKVAGCMVTEGSIKRGSKVRLVRDRVVFWEGELSALRRFKDDVQEVSSGYECGMSFAKFQDIKEGDVVEAYELIEEKRTL